MRVIHTESSTGWGGQENRTLQEALQLQQLGHQVMLIAPPGARLLSRAAEQGIRAEAVALGRGLDLRAILRLQKLYRQFAVDVVNTHSSRDTIVAGLAARLMWRTPALVRTRHLIMPITSRSTYTGLPHHVVAVSEAVRQYLMTAGVPAERVTTVRTGVDLQRFQPAPLPYSLRDELKIPLDAPLFGTVAILRVRKGHQDLLAAIPQVLQRLPDAHFVLAGDGPQQGKLQQKILDMGLQARVHMLGLRKDVPQILQTLTAFVLPTHDEALGTAYLEAQAMGVPVIGTRTGGVSETLLEGQSGLLVPVQSPDELAAAMIEMGSDLERARQMGERGRARVMQECGVEHMARGMLAVYQRLLQQRGGQHG